MLDQLDTLDDATPPEPDAAMLARVHERADRRRRRHRFTVASAGVVSLALVIGAVAVLRDRGQRVDVIGPKTTTTAPAPNRVSEGTLPNGLRIRMTVDRTTVVLGDEVRARVEVRNDTGKTQSIGSGPGVQCALGVQPTLRDSKGGYSTTDGRELACLHILGMPPGRTASFATSVSTEWLSLPRGQRRGHYDLVLLRIPNGSTIPLITEATPPVAVEVVAPDLTARLEVPVPTVAAAGVIKGTIVFDNASDSMIDAGCVHSLSYRVSLAAGDVTLNRQYFSSIGPSSNSCGHKVRLLPPGTTQFPFSVRAQYYGCSASATADPALPRCTFHNHIPETPPLPPGRYQIVFEGRGPLGSVDVTPVPIQVVAAPSK